MTALFAVVDSEGRPEGCIATQIVPWWSFTKTLIAAAALRLSEEKRLRLDAPIDGAPYTLRQLLQHRAGVGDYGALTAYNAAVARREQPWRDDQLFAHIDPAGLLFPPGAGWAYSNVGYLLVRRALERTCDADLQEILREKVLRPLGLLRSRLGVSIDDMQQTPFPGGHGYHPGWAFHGVVLGPAAEAALALHHLLCTDFLEPLSRNALLDRHPVGGVANGRPWVEAGYGLGLMNGTMQAAEGHAPLRVLGHSGSGPGSVGAVYHAPDLTERLTAAVFADGADAGAVEREALRHIVRAS
jgi:CubicO group peptidase (beta-lactamase class C family)